MKRSCNCSGGCGPKPTDDGVSRREFIALVGAGAAGAALVGPDLSAKAPEPVSEEELSRWKRSLFEAASPRLYRSGVHADARLHLGGIGTGNFELGSDGQLTTWQLFNTLHDGHVPFHFAVKAGRTARLLQTKGGPELPRIPEIEMRGEYPFAFLRFVDKDLPVKLELEAWSPFSPLDAKFSSMPLAAFVFKVQNPTGEAQEVSLAAMIQNPVGYDAAGEMRGNRHPNFKGNWNEFLSDGKAAILHLRAEAGKEPVLEKPLTIFFGPNLKGLGAPPGPAAKGLTLRGIDRLDPKALVPGSGTVLFLEEPPSDLPLGILKAAREAVQAGATLIFSGKSMPLLRNFAHTTGGKVLEKAEVRPDILFEDFEKGYGEWTVEGKAFGGRPAGGTLPNQQRVSGFQGKGLVNTYLEGDDTTGRIISKPFQVERNFIRFLVGGGSHGSTQIRLLVDGKPVRAQSGKDNERLEPAAWDVGDLAGKTARIEIVDDQKGPWGHINIDQIEFSDLPGSRAALEILDEILPARFSGIRQERGESSVLAFEGLALKPGAEESKTAGGLRLIAWPLGKGRVILAAGPILDPGEAEFSGARERAFAAIAEIAGAKYEAPVGPLPKAPGFGDLALAALGGEPTALTAFEDWKKAWEAFARDGRFSKEPAPRSEPTPPGKTVSGAIAQTVKVPPGGSQEVTFLLAWRYPNKYGDGGVWMGCHYATLWPEALAVAKEAAAGLGAIRERTERFRKTFYDSTLPYWLLDCLTSQAAIIRHIGVVFRIANGEAYGWEGSNGCCQPTCTHVWGYEQSLSRLFPELERSMRGIDFKHQQRPDGGVNNRTQVPSPPSPTGEQPFADGHSSCILKAYREALNSPDESFFQEYWPHIKRAVDYLIGRDAARSGGTPSGILQDDQWNTYDEALHGVTAFIGTYYLAALRAGEEWARRAGDEESARKFRSVFEKGQAKLVELCWEGEYFRQHLPGYEKMPGEVGPGCMSDQLIGQWWAHQLGLGYLLPKDKVQSALRAVFRHNWKHDLTGWKHMPRAFAGNLDKGLIICTWPKGGRPGHVMLYSDEVWTGIEYQVAGHMVYEGMIEEAYAIVKGARDRYDGIPRAPIPRNPWNEIECGGHYARAMSSWSLLLALSGWELDGPRKALRFTPRVAPERFRGFFAGPEGWGSLSQSREGDRQRNGIAVREGTLSLREIRLAPKAPPRRLEITAAGRKVEGTLKADGDLALVTLAEPIVLKEGETLEVVLS